MQRRAKAHYDGIVAFSQTDFTEDLKKITVPVLVMHGDDDQIVPYADSAPLSAKLVKNGTLKTYHGFPHPRPRPSTPTCSNSSGPDRTARHRVGGAAEAEWPDVVDRADDVEQDHVAPVTAIAVTGRRPENLDSRPRQSGSSAAVCRPDSTRTTCAQAGAAAGARKEQRIRRPTGASIYLCRPRSGRGL